MYHFLEILHFFQYTTIKMIIFCACKNLLNNKNVSKDTQIIVLNGCEKFWLKETFLKVDLVNKMAPKLWLLWWRFAKLCTTEEACYRYFETKSPSLTGNVCYHYNSWVTGVHIACLFHRNSGGKTSQIVWFLESNLRSFGCFKCSTAFWLWLSLNPSCKDNSLTRTGWALQA